MFWSIFHSIARIRFFFPFSSPSLATSSYFLERTSLFFSAEIGERVKSPQPLHPKFLVQLVRLAKFDFTISIPSAMVESPQEI